MIIVIDVYRLRNIYKIKVVATGVCIIICDYIYGCYKVCFVAN